MPISNASDKQIAKKPTATFITTEKISKKFDIISGVEVEKLDLKEEKENE